MNICIGIISYLPNNKLKRYRRLKKLNDLIDSCNNLFNLPITIIAQNWENDRLQNTTNVNIIYFKDKLGIVGARKALRDEFLKSNYNYLIMLDDDCELSGDSESAIKYIKQIELHPGMCGLFSGTVLKLFAISKELFSLVNYGDGNVEDGDFFEDILFVNTIKKKFPNRVFTFNRHNLKQKSNNFNDKDSTWYWGQYNKHDIGDRTRKILGDL